MADSETQSSRPLLRSKRNLHALLQGGEQSVLDNKVDPVLRRPKSFLYKLGFCAGKEAPQEEVELVDALELDEALGRLECCLYMFGFRFGHASFLGVYFSLCALLLLAVLLPVLILEHHRSQESEKFQIICFELKVLASQAILAAVALVCISWNLGERSFRDFLLLDQSRGEQSRIRRLYVDKTKGFFNMLIWCMLPPFILKLARDIMRIIYISHQRWFSIAILLALLFSWAYLTSVFLSACILFNLMCNLQVIRFDEYTTSFKQNRDVLTLLNEHRILKSSLSDISHRFRMYLLLAFFVVSVSQALTLLQTTAYHDIINFINGGDFAVSSIVELVGSILCLHAAAKISHRAQGVASVACEWHASLTCESTEGPKQSVTNSIENDEACVRSSYSDHAESDSLSQQILANAIGKLEANARPSDSTASFESDPGSKKRVPDRVVNSEANVRPSNYFDNSESDLGSQQRVGNSVRISEANSVTSISSGYLENSASLATNPSPSPCTTSFQKRQALVMYLQSNPGGLTIFGWTVDRALLNIILSIELSLVLFVLSKTIVF